MVKFIRGWGPVSRGCERRDQVSPAYLQQDNYNDGPRSLSWYGGREDKSTSRNKNKTQKNQRGRIHGSKTSMRPSRKAGKGRSWMRNGMFELVICEAMNF